MAVFTWSDQFSVGVKEFDDHHKQLVSLINQLHDAMSQGQGQNQLAVILKKLIDYTRFHFAAEEKLMTQYKYPAGSEQRLQHDALTKQVLKLQAEFASGKIGMSIAVIEFLKDWLTNHILKTDKAYRAFFNGLGVH
jgi:hemerythrin